MKGVEHRLARIVVSYYPLVATTVRKESVSCAGVLGTVPAVSNVGGGLVWRVVASRIRVLIAMENRMPSRRPLRSTLDAMI